MIAASAWVLADCVTPIGQDCNHDEGPTWNALTTFSLTVEILIGLVGLAIVLGLVVWARGRARSARGADDR